jgi:hypothetical protein
LVLGWNKKALLRSENEQVQLTNSSELDLTFKKRDFCAIPKSSRSENKKIQLTDSSKIDLTLDFFIYS